MRKRTNLPFPWKEILLLLLSLLISFSILEVVLRIAAEHRGKSSKFFVQNYEFKMWDSLNKDGLRGPLVSSTSMRDKKSIFVIGDSFIYGVGTTEQQSIPALLSDLYYDEQSCGVSVFNLGRPGAGPTLYEQTADWYKQYKPDVVVVGIYMDNDIEDRDVFVKKSSDLVETDKNFIHSELLNSVKNLAKKYRKKFTYEDEECIAKKNTGIDVLSYNLPHTLEEAMCNELMNPHLLPRSRVGDNDEYYFHLAHTFSEGSVTKNNLLKIRDIFQDSNFVLLLIPSKYQVSTDYFDPMRELGFTFAQEKLVNRHLQDSIMEWARLHEIQTIDILPNMSRAEQESGIDFYYDYDDHLNVQGNQFVARILYEQLQDLFLCK